MALPNKYPKDYDSFRPDWTENYTAQDMEREFKGFKFNGPGWYFTTTEAILVTPLQRPIEKIWDESYDVNENFHLSVYSGYNPQSLFVALAEAPVRQ